MKSIFKPVLASVLLSTAALTAFSQAPAHPMGHDAGTVRMGQKEHPQGMNPASMQAHMDKRNAALKAKLKLSAAQEADWAAYVTAMKPAADMMTRKAQHDELAKLPTPERIDKMKTLRSQHMAEMNTAMDKQGEATKAFYMTLTPEQKKTFDQSMPTHHSEMGQMGQMGDMLKGKHPAPAKP